MMLQVAWEGCPFSGRRPENIVVSVDKFVEPWTRNPWRDTPQFQVRTAGWLDKIVCALPSRYPRLSWHSRLTIV